MRDSSQQATPSRRERLLATRETPRDERDSSRRERLLARETPHEIPRRDCRHSHLPPLPSPPSHFDCCVSCPPRDEASPRHLLRDLDLVVVPRPLSPVATAATAIFLLSPHLPHVLIVVSPALLATRRLLATRDSLRQETPLMRDSSRRETPRDERLLTTRDSSQETPQPSSSSPLSMRDSSQRETPRERDLAT